MATPVITTRSGVLSAIAATAIWGLSPLYYKQLADVPALELLAHRTVWSVLLFLGVLFWQRRVKELRFFLTSRRAFLILLVASASISANWGLFILSVQMGWVTESSLGYYMMPLMMVALGVIFLRERLDWMQWSAVGLAALAVLSLTLGMGGLPWLPLTLATSFSLYGMIKRGLAVGPTVSVTAELLLMLPIAIAWLAVVEIRGESHFGHDLKTTSLLVFSGLLSALPLILFSRAARGVSFATLGLLQYTNPTLQFLCAVMIFHEPFAPVKALAFLLIWVALAIYSTRSIRQEKARRRMAMASSGDVAV